MKQRTLHSLFAGCAPYLTSALLLGLSYPSYPYIRLEFLAWCWMVPMLVALERIDSFLQFLRNVYLTMLVVFVFGMSWLLASHVLGTILVGLLGAAVFTVPFAAFFFVRRSFGWRVALWSAPVVWTAWDWLYQQSEGSFGWIGIGFSQANLYWLVQYVDITGVWGITFWVLLFNVLVIRAIEDRGSRIGDRGLRIEDRNIKQSSILDPRSSILDCSAVSP
jgi:apolipoprotein N-acyltransferase